ncbi:hypothetical protein Goarm_004086 [Gossypium armourianum]|uniref:Uncharacterized protein n=1 Tax=Gossypium armourianum TaxID=34283 RepID=A0A7J9K549_9ROSI|nr:hypothetical protein [Gossypium armourianum]
MGPIKGFKRRKKTADKKVVEHNVLPSSLGSQPQPLDWWDEFSNRISDILGIMQFVFVLCLPVMLRFSPALFVDGLS